MTEDMRFHLPIRSNAETHTLSGAPSANDFGVIDLWVVATDPDGLNAIQSFELICL
ncbi:MAG: hypothetical protein LBE06_00190 [Azoarcus sp.]|jgi:hypothetical protein|nr:hypothetical protein [Azoarcus sp.]